MGYHTFPPTQQCWTVMRFWVKVPVLSLAMTLVEPSVSTACKFLTRTFLANIRFAVKASATVTVTRRPSGTLATIIPIANTIEVMAAYGVSVSGVRVRVRELGLES